MGDITTENEQSRAEYLQEFFSEAFTNNSFDYVPMHSSLRKIYDNAYVTTKRFQKAIQGYKEFQFFSNDDTHYTDDPDNEKWSRDLIHPGNLYVDEHLNACIDLEYTFISHANREDFRTSRFYHTWFTFDDVVENRDLFTKLPVIIIDNQVLFDYKIYVDRSYMKIRLPYKSDFVYYHDRNLEKDRIKYIDHQITVQMIDNVYWGHNVNPIVLNEREGYVGNLDRVKNTLRLPYDYFANTIDYAKLYDHFPHAVDGRVGLYFAVIHFTGEGVRHPELGSFLYDVDCDDKTHTFTLHLDDQIVEKINGPFHVTLIWYNELRKHTFFNGNDYTIAGDCGGEKNNECFLPVIQRDELVPFPMPISVENMFVMRTSHGIEVPEDHFIFEYRYLPETGKEFEVYHVEDKDLYYIWYDDKWEPITEFFIDGGRSLSSGPMTLKEYYPNIYQIVDRPRREGEKYEVYYFYHEDWIYRYQYTPLTLFWHYFLKWRCTQDKENLVSIEEAINAIFYGTESGTSIRNKLSQNYQDYSVIDGADLFVQQFAKYLEYNPYEYIYGDVDFYHKYVDVPHSVDFEDNTYPIEYKIAKMHEWIRQDQEYLRDYVVAQKRLGTRYHLFVNDLCDYSDPDVDPMSQYIRKDTSEEVMLEGEGVYTFKDDMYVFSLQNDDPSEDLPCIVYVDGLMCMDIHQVNVKDITYIYLPVSMVTPESYIEVEIRPSYEFKQEIQFQTLGDEKEIILVEPEQGIYPTVADLYFEDVVTPTPEEAVVHRYSNSNFEITAHYRDMRNEAYNIKCDVPLDPEDDPKIRFTRLLVFTVRPKTSEVVGIPLNLRFSKCADLLRVTMSHDGFPYLSLVDRKFKYNSEYLRIFKDGRLIDWTKLGFPENDYPDFKEGRLMPEEKYSFISTYDHPRLVIYEWMKQGDQIMIDISPFRYKQILYMEELPAGETVIDLSGIITKPFDYRYYDVYLNGRRLSMPNIVSIDAWSITLVNLFTTKNLQIFEKERDWEYFGLKYKEDDGKSIFYFAKEDILNSDFINEEERNAMIKKIIDDRAEDKGFEIFNNIDAENPMDFTDFSKSYMMMIFYLHELIPKTYLNPDSFQTEEDLLEDEYPNVLKNYMVPDATVKTVLLDPNVYTNKDDKFALNENNQETSSDTNVNEGDPSLSYTQVVCMVGNEYSGKDIPEGIVNQDITVKNNKPIGGGE